MAQLRLKLVQMEQWLAASHADAQRGAAECRLQAGQLDAMREELDESRATVAAGVSRGEKVVVRTIEPSALQLSSELKREVEAVRKEWTGSTNALALAQAEAVSAVAERAVAPHRLRWVARSDLRWLARSPTPLRTPPPHVRGNGPQPRLHTSCALSSSSLR